jgi:hypothetical protein
MTLPNYQAYLLIGLMQSCNYIFIHKGEYRYRFYKTSGRAFSNPFFGMEVPENEPCCTW